MSTDEAVDVLMVEAAPVHGWRCSSHHGHACDCDTVNGYEVTSAKHPTATFRCGECVCSKSPSCPCLWEAMDFARRRGEGARVMRGRVVLAVTARRYAEVGEADVANGRPSKRRARVAS